MTTRRLALQTPEEVPLVFELAPIGSRVLAFTLDLLFIFTVVVVIALVFSWASGGYYTSDGDNLLEALLGLIIFFVWNFYFIFTELRWHGRTIGKRVAGIRVIARDGGPLTSDLVFARNLTRDIEWVFPLIAILDSSVLGIDSPALLVVCWVWLGVMAFLPLLNRYHCRVGDLVAGTLVVAAPVERLLPDLIAEAAAAKEEAARRGKDDEYKFTQDQLDTYGIHELQILEDVLRRYPQQIDPELLQTIAHKIQMKIRWQPEPSQRVEAYPFLRAFYAAQRARLEHQMLFGQRREHKVR